MVTLVLCCETRDHANTFNRKVVEPAHSCPAACRPALADYESRLKTGFNVTLRLPCDYAK